MRKLLLVTILHLLFTSLVSAQISGVVYRDFNGDGIRGTAIPSVEPGVGGVIVNAYNSSEALVANTVSDNTGAYSLATTGNVRVEFVIPAAMNCLSTAFDFTGFHNDGNNIRFITGSASNVNYGILFPDDYTPNANPFVYVPIFHSGNPLGVGTAASASGFLGYEFNSVGTPTNLKTATASGIGAVWGTAYSKQANKIFTAAFIKRQVGLGPMGSGGIYMLEPTASSFNITQFYDMDANGYRTRAANNAPAYGQGSSYTVDANGYVITYNGGVDPESGFEKGLGVVGTNTERGLPDNMNADSYDPASFDQVGKVGLGDLDISDDGKFLFVMNLYSRKLYRLELNDAYNPTSVVSVNSYSIPSVAVTNGELRPFAVQYRRGKIYCGAVASGENGGSNTVDGPTDLYAYVFEMTNPLGSASFNNTPILSFPLNYQKGYAITTMNFPANNKWFPWTNNANSALPDPYGETMYPTPMFTNIDFSDRGDMILDFTDRSGHQFGYNNYKYLSTSFAYVGLDIGGDVLIAGRDCSTGGWTLENNGAINSNGTTLIGNSTTNDEGPGTGEFFAQDRATDDYHHETSQGAVAIVPGTADGIFTVMDPVGIFQGGTSRFSTENGVDANRTILYFGSDGEFSKANGLGDIEVAGEEPPIEVGNLVWNDANGDGIQSAGEVGIGNVTLELFCDFDNNNTPDGGAIATVNTNTDGQWYFNETNVSDGDCNAAGAQLGLQPNKTYIVRIGSADWSGGAGTGDLALKGLTLLNSTSAGMVDKSDNDASLVSSVPQLQFTTGKWGENNHSYDFGFSDCIANAGNNISLNCTVTSGIIGTTAVSGNTYSWSPATGLNNASIAQPTASPTTTTTYTLTVNGICTDEVTVTVDNAVPIADAGNNVTLTCTTASAMIGTVAISGNTYSWSPSTGLNNAAIATPTATPTATTTYTVTVTGANACTATDVVTVAVDKSAPSADAGNNVTLTCTTTSAMIGTAAISGNTYSWSPSTGLNNASIAQPTATPTVNTNYTITVTGSNGCTATDVVSVTIDNIPPSISILGNLEVCNGGATTLTANGGVSWIWMPNNETSNSISAVAGSYTVTATASNGCTATASANVSTVEAMVGNFVWHDQNGNGIFDEPVTDGLNGILIELWKETSSGSNVYTLFADTTTANNGLGNPGYYQFVVCDAANYKIKFPTTTGLSKLTNQTVIPEVDLNSDASVTDGFSPVFALDPNGTGFAVNNMTIDAGYYQLASLGNYVWNDINHDGVQNANEVGVAGISVTLYDNAGTPISTTLTDAYGYYLFDQLMAGDYTVGFTLPQNYVFTTTLGTSETDATNSDVNTASGKTTTVTLSSGEHQLNVDAGIYFQPQITATVGNYVWFDVNNDGTQDNTEVGISGVTVSLYNSAGNVVATTITDGSGLYLFTDVAPGNYTIGFTSPIGFIPTVNIGGVSNATNSDANPVNGKTASFTVNAGDHITYVDAGYVPQPTTTASLGDRVWYDVNQNGTQDNGELGVLGVTVTLYQSNGTSVVSTTTTDAYGNYIFNNLVAGQYVVGFTSLPTNYVLTATTGTNETTNSDANTATAKTGIIDLSSGEHDMTWDAGIYNSIPTNTNSIGDYVWNDVDKDGVQDANEQGVAGVTVTLYDYYTDTPISTTSTNANGLYLFPDLPNGANYVGFSNLPQDFVFSPTGFGNSIIDSDPNTSTGLTTSLFLTGNTHVTSLDAGIHLGNPNVGTASLGDKVWYDMNNDGLQDTDEAGVQGVTVTLYQLIGNLPITPIATTTTNALGYYVFTGLEAGTYEVGFTNLPAGFTITSKDADSQGIEGETNSDVNAGSQQTDPINLALGQDKMSVDMGIVPPAGTAALGDLVWYDLNNDGLQTNGEPGVQGVSVTLYDNTNTAVANTTTDANGEYHFVGLTPGTYSVGFNNLPSGYAFTTQSGAINDATNSDANTTTGMTATVTLAAGDNNLNLDAGITSTTVASVGDYVWYDINHDGIQDTNEPGLGGILVTLYDHNNNPVASTITNPDGSYIFTNVTPGDYTMGFGNLPSGMTFTTQETNPNSNTGSNVNPSTGFTPSFTVTAGTHNPSIDAGLTTSPLAGLGNYVWYDNNRDGVQGANETGVAGAIATLYTSNGTTELAHAITNGDGGYSFTNLPAGDYIVGFSNLPITYEATKSNGTLNDASNSDMNPVSGKTTIATLSAGEYNPNLDAGIMKPFAQLGNYVWNDLDKDGVQDANEVGVAGITVMLYNATNQVVGSTITDGYGYYKFNPLEDGIYTVSFTLPANYVFSDANQGSDDELDSDVNPATGWTTTYTLMPGDSNMSIDAGIHFESANTATVGNFVWYDTNQDGIQDAGDEGISGVTVTLYDNIGAIVATMITNSNGFYLFTDVAPGTYSVGFTPPAGLSFSPNNGGVNNPSNSDVIPSTGVTSTFTVNAGDHITYVDAGLYSLPVNLGGLGDKVWYDVNQNGVQDAGESGVPDVTVTLFQSDGTTQINQTQTDAFGNYIFNNLPQGQYIVGFSNLPLGYTLSPTSGTDSTTNSDANQVDGKTAIIYLSQGQFNMTYDAGIYNTTPSNNNSIGNYVWVDIDKDGIQDVGEPGRSGITATLYNSSNVGLETTSTDASGYYLFPNLPNGDYYVGFSNLPANFVFTQTGAGTSTTDSDPNLVTGMTATVSLTGNTHDMSLDAGIYRGSLRIGIDASLGDIVWYDMNGNGIQDAGEAGVPGITVTLYESDATTVISTTTTNSLGNYIFTGLVEETYVVGFSNLPVGFTISPKNADTQGLNGELNSDVNVGTQQTDAILLGEGEDKLSVDMGIVPPLTSASLGNLVWFDLNNDGLQNSGEPGVQGVGVALLDNAGNALQYTTTNGNGEYYFVGLSPDTYAVEFSNLPSGYSFTQANADATGINGAQNSDADIATGQTATVTLTAGENNLNLDAGIISTTVAAVGDYVWYDENRDGLQDATEVGVGGVLVTLYDNTGTPVTSTITTPDGAYIFTNVTPGDYTIGFDNIPDGMEFTQEVGTATDNTNSNADPITGITDAITVTPGSYNPTIDAGITIPATAGLGNYVWLDVNENGLQDASEPSVAGVVATLYASNGTTVLAKAVTDGNGAYSFTNLDEGTYVVGFSNLPLGSVPTQNVGVLNDALNSDMNILTRKTTPVFLPSGTFNPNLDAGIYFGIPVPVHELKANYAVIKDGGLCDVYWYTTDEKNAVNFDIERSLDGVQFTKVGTKDAIGTTIGRSIYSATDDITSISNEPIIYYRIRLNDFDGHSMLSNVISVSSDATGGSVVYPSPFTNELTILYPSTGNSELDILLTDGAGRTIRHENKVLDNGLNMIRIDGLDALATGQYYIKLRDFNSGETFIHKVSK